LLRAQCLRRQDEPVEDEVRDAPHQHLVLRARGLSLDAVSDHHRPPARLRDRAQLAAGREGAAAAAGEAACLDQPGQVARGGEIPPAGPVLGERDRACPAPEPGEQAGELLRRGRRGHPRCGERAHPVNSSSDEPAGRPCREPVTAPDAWIRRSRSRRTAPPPGGRTSARIRCPSSPTTCPAAQADAPWGSRPTTLSVISTPPPSSGMPRSATCTRPAKPPRARPSIETTTSPCGASVSRRRPAKAARKLPPGSVASACRAAARARGRRDAAGVRVTTAASCPRAAAASSVDGVPARAAQPRRSGPFCAHTSRPASTPSVATVAPARTIGSASRAASRRQTTDASTVTAHSTPRTASQPERASLPVPSECSSATGQEAYASQCTARQARKPIRRRARLVATSASRRSNATVPRPSQKGRYGERKGMTASRRPIGANASAIVVITCTAVKAMAMSVTLRCRPETRKRGQRALRQRTELITPSSTETVSRTSATDPDPRVRYQSSLPLPVAANSAVIASRDLRRPAGDVERAAASCDEPRRQPPLGQPRRRLLAEDDGGRAGGVRVQAGGGGDGYGAPRGGRGPARPRVEDVVQTNAAGSPAAHGRARAGEAAAAERDHRSRRARRGRVVVGEQDRPSAGGDVAPQRDVAAERDEGACAARGARRAGGEVGRERLGGRAQVELHARGNAHRAPLLAELDLAPAPGGREGDAERAVVAGEAERAADGRVDETAGGGRRAERGAEGAEEHAADRRLAPGGRVQPRELGVGAEPAAGAVDLAEQALDGGAGGGERLRLGCAHGRRRAEGAEAGRGDGHEPPLTATGGAWVAAGGCGGGAGADDCPGAEEGEGTAAPLPGSGGREGGGGAPCAARAGGSAARTARAGLTGGAGRDGCGCLRPEFACAARPANRPVSAVAATVSARVVERRRRRPVSLSCGCARGCRSFRTLAVEQAEMKRP